MWPGIYDELLLLFLLLLLCGMTHCSRCVAIDNVIEVLTLCFIFCLKSFNFYKKAASNFPLGLRGCKVARLQGEASCHVTLTFMPHWRQQLIHIHIHGLVKTTNNFMNLLKGSCFPLLPKKSEP